MGRGTDSERPAEIADQASDTEAAMSNKLAEQVAVWVEQGFLHSQTKDGGFVREATHTEKLLAKEIDRLASQIAGLKEFYDNVMSLSATWDEHPKGWQGACCCRLCQEHNDG